MFKRIMRLFTGWMSLFVGGIEKSNPRALLEAEIQAFHKAMASYNTNLAKQAGMAERLKAQVAKEKKQIEMLTAKITACISANQTESAATYAFQLKQLKSELAENETQLKESDDLYEQLRRQRDVYVKETQRTIENIKSKISKAEMAEAQAKLAEIASSTAFEIGGSGETMARLNENLDERIADAKGRNKVAGDSIENSGWVMKESEQKALEAQALAEFANAHGMSNPYAAAEGFNATPADAEAPKKDLGPKATE